MYTQPKNVTAGEAVTLKTLAKMKHDATKIACLTAYDASFAAVLDNAGVDLVLVGDTLGMVIQGHPTTLPVSMDDMVYHTRNVSRGLRRALLVADMPFLSYSTPAKALDNAGWFMQEAGASMVKLEGGSNQAEAIQQLADNGIPVCAHLGLRPQLVHKLGGFKVQGKAEAAARQILEDALTLEQAGADIILLECVPSHLGKEITQRVKVPVIGIGAGPDVDGQILVLYDMLDITPGHKPRFARNFMQDAGNVEAAVKAYVAAVRDGSYPAPEHCFS